MRKIIAGLQTSLDCFIEGPNGELDWAMADDEETWRETFDALDSTDALILGRVMYPAYEQYWLAVLSNPTGVLPMSGAPATKHEIAFARRADEIPHFVLSRTLEKVEWKTTSIIRDIDDIRRMKKTPGKDMQVIGGAMLVSNLLNAGLLDEIRLIINPLVLGGGKSLFKNVKERHALKLLRAKPLRSGKVSLAYDASS